MELCNGCKSTGVHLLDDDSGDGVQGVDQGGGQGHGELVCIYQGHSPRAIIGGGIIQYYDSLGLGS